jgi:hypothetical protein
MRCGADSDLKTTSRREKQDAKHDSGMEVAFAGKQIDFSDDSENA